MPCRVPKEMKGDDIVAVEKSLESEAWAQLWTLRITHLQSGEPVAHRLTRWDVAGGLSRGGTVAAWVKLLLDKWDRWPGGPSIVFPETLLSSGRHLQGLAVAGREDPSPETLPPCSLAALPTAAFCGLASQASYALYTELGCTLPVFDGCCPPSAMPEVFPQPWREALIEG